MTDIIHLVNNFLIKYRLRNILLIIILVFIFQAGWKIFEIMMDWNALLKPLYDLSIKVNVNSVSWILPNIFNIPAHPDHDIIRLHGTALQIMPACEGLKQMLLFLFLIGLFPGKQVHKLWFVPLGLIEIIFLNIFRFCGLCITLLQYPRLFNIIHDNVFYFIYYVNIFFLWLIWETKFTKKNIKGIKVSSK